MRSPGLALGLRSSAPARSAPTGASSSAAKGLSLEGDIILNLDHRAKFCNFRPRVSRALSSMKDWADKLDRLEPEELLPRSWGPRTRYLRHSAAAGIPAEPPSGRRSCPALSVVGSILRPSRTKKMDMRSLVLRVRTNILGFTLSGMDPVVFCASSDTKRLGLSGPQSFLTPFSKSKKSRNNSYAVHVDEPLPPCVWVRRPTLKGRDDTPP